jgi:bla regulator protein blaR1
MMSSSIFISVIVTGLLKPLMILLVMSVLWILLRKKSAALQHFVLSLGVVSILLLPFCAGALPHIEWARFPSLANIMLVPVSWFEEINIWLQNHINQKNFLMVAGIYLLVTTWLLFYLLLGIIGLALQTRRAQKVISPGLISQLDELRELVDVSRKIDLVSSRSVSSPQTWGLLRPVIMLPHDALLWDQDKQLSVLIHELGHIARWDWLTTLLVKITCACFWFLLPLWWMAQKIYQQAELACDDYIYKLHNKQVAYAQNLLAIASSETSHKHANQGLQMRGQSPIGQRIMAILDQQRPHQSVPMEAAQYWLICGGFLLVLVAGVQLMPLQQQWRSQKIQFLHIEFPQPNTPAPAQSAPRTEQFSWELLQQLKPAVYTQPSHLDLPVGVEALSIEVAKPTAVELKQLAALQDANNFLNENTQLVPDIRIEGFLPIEMVTPEYPSAALLKGVEGWVQVEFTIDTNGNIIRPTIIGHSPSRIFDRAVLTALKKSRYRPQLLNGEPVVVQGVTELFRFTLSANQQDAVIDKHRR